MDFWEEIPRTDAISLDFKEIPCDNLIYLHINGKLIMKFSGKMTCRVRCHPGKHTITLSYGGLRKSITVDDSRGLKLIAKVKETDLEIIPEYIIDNRSIEQKKEDCMSKIRTIIVFNLIYLPFILLAILRIVNMQWE